MIQEKMQRVSKAESSVRGGNSATQQNKQEYKEVLLTNIKEFLDMVK